MCQITI